jgi:hypothetical protein
VSKQQQAADSERIRDDAPIGLAHNAARMAETIKKDGTDKNPSQRSIGGGVVHTPETEAALKRVGSDSRRTDYVEVDKSDGPDTYQYYRYDNLPATYRLKDE